MKYIGLLRDLQSASGVSDQRAIAAKVADDMLAQARGFSDAGILKPELVRQTEEHLSE